MAGEIERALEAAEEAAMNAKDRTNCSPPGMDDMVRHAIAAFLRALPGLSVASVRRGSAVLRMGDSADGTCWSGEELARAVEQAGGGDGA